MGGLQDGRASRQRASGQHEEGGGSFGEGCAINNLAGQVQEDRCKRRAFKVYVRYNFRKRERMINKLTDTGNDQQQEEREA